MRKLPVFVLAAATALTVGVPMTAQAATCPTSTSNCINLSNCFGQSGDINSILSKLGCNSNGNSCSNGSTCTKGASCSGGNCSTSKNRCSTGSCSRTKAAATNNGRQCKSSYSYWR